MANLRGFYNHFCTLLSDDQRGLYSYVEGECPSILLLRGVVVLTAQSTSQHGYDAAFSALQVKEPKIYTHGARLLEHFADFHLPLKDADPNAALHIALYGAGYQSVIGITALATEPQYATGTILRKGTEREVSRICGVIIRRKQ